MSKNKLPSPPAPLPSTGEGSRLPSAPAPRRGEGSKSAFKEGGFGPTVQAVKEEIRELYLWDQVPWVIGYSGGKDSSTVLQLVWTAVAELPPEKRQKTIHVISTDTLVEQPMVAMWVDASHEKMRAAAQEQGMPVVPHKLTPEVKDTYWVNLMGKGYPAPRKLFRWCTDRLKIKPSNKFIREVVRESGEAILVLGTRKAESQKRAATMERYEQKRVRERLTPNAKLPNSRVYTPIEDWANDDVWLYLMQVKNPWGHNNKSLLTMYQGATSGGECPLVVDTSTPSCGTSRFGCWVCTLVDQDRSMEAMIANDEEKVWMTPLLELRNELGEPNDRSRRDYRRLDGRVQLFHDSTVPGPYKREWREHWLRRVLEAQEQVRRLGPPEVQASELISMDELREIRRIWLQEKHEFQDSLPRIYEEVTGRVFPKPDTDDAMLGAEDWDLLKTICGDDENFFTLQTELLDIERQFRGMSRRPGIYEALEDRLRARQYASEEEAVRIRTEQTVKRDAGKRHAHATEAGNLPAPQRTLFDPEPAQKTQRHTG
ncbi:MAG: DNA phosphorothioation system sulfurtransferase DndC [Planctomycetota bacterium]